MNSFINPRKFIFFFATAPVVVLFLSQLFSTELPEKVRLASGATLEWHECTFKTSFFQVAFCANYHTAEYVNKVEIVLPVVILRKRFSHDDSLSPLIYLNGGPGYASGLDNTWIHYWWDWKSDIGWRGDIILFDQRGTGLSTPRLHCDRILPMAEKILPQHLTFDAEQSVWHKLTLECIAEIKQQGFSFGFLTTQRSAKDVMGIMQSVAEAMKYQHYTVYGVSYGTRLLLEVIRQNKNNTRLIDNVILDSVYPLSVEAILAYPEQTQSILDLIINGCRRDNQCHAKWPDLKNTLLSLLEQLETNPVKLIVSHPADSDKPIQVTVNDHRLMGILLNALYYWNLIEDLPLIINEAKEGDHDALKPLVQAFVDMMLDDQMEDMTYLAVECADQSALISRDDYVKEVARYPQVEKYTRSVWDYEVCKDWPVHAATVMKRAVKSDIPALILSGEYDPVTPVVWARRVSQKFNNGQWHVFPGIGHGVLLSDECAVEVTQSFIMNPKRLDKPECLDYLYDISFNLGD